MSLFLLFTVAFICGWELGHPASYLLTLPDINLLLCPHFPQTHPSLTVTHPLTTWINETTALHTLLLSCVGLNAFCFSFRWASCLDSYLSQLWKSNWETPNADSEIMQWADWQQKAQCTKTLRVMHWCCRVLSFYVTNKLQLSSDTSSQCCRLPFWTWGFRFQLFKPPWGQAKKCSLCIQ